MQQVMSFKNKQNIRPTLTNLKLEVFIYYDIISTWVNGHTEIWIRFGAQFIYHGT